jgi:hypothetical protein
MRWDPMRTEASLRCCAAATCIVHRPSPLLSDTVFGSPLDGARKEPADRNWDPMWTELTWTTGTTSKQPSPCSPSPLRSHAVPIQLQGTHVVHSSQWQQHVVFKGRCLKQSCLRWAHRRCQALPKCREHCRCPTRCHKVWTPAMSTR